MCIDCLVICLWLCVASLNDSCTTKRSWICSTELESQKVAAGSPTSRSTRTPAAAFTRLGSLLDWCSQRRRCAFALLWCTFLQVVVHLNLVCDYYQTIHPTSGVKCIFQAEHRSVSARSRRRMQWGQECTWNNTSGDIMSIWQKGLTGLTGGAFGEGYSEHGLRGPTQCLLFSPVK